MTSCTSDTELPPERPKGEISGTVVDGIISEAEVSVYEFGDARRGARLGSTTTDVEGKFSVEIQARDQLILIETSGGKYKEQATDVTVDIAGDQKLQAIAFYESGSTVSAVVTPLTHLVSALTQYKIDHGKSANQAFNEAKSTIDVFFTLDSHGTIPLDITASSDSVNALSDEALYGFMLASISNWSLWASKQNKVEPHTVYTSIGLIQLMYNDLIADGFLDGIGFGMDNSNLTPLGVGVVPLDTETYRAMFSLHLLAVSTIANNTTNLKPGDLQITAQDLAEKSSNLFADSTPLDINSQTPELSLAQPLQEAYSGTLSLQINIGGFLGAETISVSFDGFFLAQLTNAVNPQLILDTTKFPPDGNHTISFLATDTLGNTATKDIVINIDNTNPVVNVTSLPFNNSTPAAISGTYSDNLSGIDTILVNDQTATLDQEGNWNINVELLPGENIIPVRIIDKAGNESVIQTIQYLDLESPVIDTSAGHSAARFSVGSGEFNLGTLQDTNDSSALYIETNRLDLMSAGIPIERSALDNNLIPYFAFSVADEIISGIPTDVTDITVRVQYEKDGEILNPWHLLPLPNTGSEYLIPLASETLSSEWHQATQLDTHSILVEVTDPAGNVTVKTFSFRTDFQVPALDSANIAITDPGTSTFTATAFQDRATLNGLQYESVAYQTLKNPVDKSIYIQPQDNSTHSVNQIVEQLVKEHQYRRVTYTEWQIRLMTPSLFLPCPGDNAAAWQPVTELFSWENNAWVPRLVPDPVADAIEFVPSDELPPNPAPTNWIDVPHFDQDFANTQITSTGSTVSYDFDYVLQANPTAPAAFVSNWQLLDPGNNTTNCPEAKFFQQRDVVINESEPGFPKPVTSEITPPNLPGFFTTGFTVFDIDADTLIAPVNGWYKIPAGHSFTITKLVTNPNLVNYDDVLDPANASYTTALLYDKSITWSVNRELEVLVIHDAGEPNILDMTPVDNILGSGFSNYLIAR